MTGYEQPYAMDHAGQTALNRLDEELERLEKVIELLYHRVEPIRQMRVELESVHGLPTEKTDAISALRGRAERLGELTGRIDRLINQLDV
jgi:hypothetical protein